ncbi:hypothetical protein ACFR9U_16755 [Halorientalis brevis]|uniref:Ba3-type terminal oxidase subunit CbaD n=1 Tax=Halorientalis brevis TaxID=1126241 RepID=A0ABD6CG21_9EURY|nr:hypothetical protein [Halorientalis brevis]
MAEVEAGTNTEGDIPGADAYADGTLVRDPEVETPLSQEEFDPKGTLMLLLIYFIILTLMWSFTYFVEFLGRTGTVIG